MSWLLNAIYVFAAVLLSPLMVYRVLVLGKNRDGWAEKLLGRVPMSEGNRPVAWFHAVSVGEVLQLQTILAEFKKTHPEWECLISTTTHTGLAVANDKFPEDTVSYFPFDFSWAVKSAICRVNPGLIVLVELELWPNFIWEAHRQEIPLALINGRISERSFRGYHRIRFLMKSLLPRFSVLAVQSHTYGERLEKLGASADRIHITGSIKFDGIQADRNQPETRELRTFFGLQNHEKVFIAGSTQSPEEEIALNVYSQLKQNHPELRLTLVPRHRERFEEVARLVESRGFSLIRRSQSTRPEISADAVLLLDTLGELSACWGLADFAFVGGSLTNRGGQNMIEPSAYSAAVCFGPNTRNFRDVVEILRTGNAATVVANAEELIQTLKDWIEYPGKAQIQGARARELVFTQQGATQKTIELLGPLIARAKPATEQRAA